MSVVIYSIDLAEDKNLSSGLSQRNLDQINQSIAPAKLSLWQTEQLHLVTGTHFGFVYQGHPLLLCNAEPYRLHPGMYFCLPGAGQIQSEGSTGLVVTCPNYRGLFSLGGPIEQTGRFAYIDGGTNTLLIPPIHQGDPCFNALYFPPRCDQTLHSHPSYRLGLVISGSGECETPEGVVGFQAGQVIWIPAQHLHKFRTTTQSLTLVMFHPDSEVGFGHRNNPMLNRTLVEGVSAAQIPQIQTPLG